jgi:hypothetical protein
MPSPYSGRPAHTFWKSAVSDRHFSDLTDLIPEIDGLQTARIATAGSCFAQHFGHHLRLRGLNYIDMEPAPRLLEDGAAARLGYGLFSCRYGNVYTARQLVQLMQEAWGQREPVEAIWKHEGRFFDALRPSVEEGGFGSIEELREMRAYHLRRVKRMFETLDIFVFTLGLTETWVSAKDGTAYPSAPGVIAGGYTPSDYTFVNLRFAEVLADLEEVRTRLLKVNPSARMLLTVSPVGLAATATDNHVLTATTYSKSVLRAVAGEMADAHPDVQYFPSYEIITGQPARHALYAPDLREVSAHGVSEVMRQFFAVNQVVGAAQQDPEEPPDDFGYEHCDDSLLDEDAPT